MSGNCADNVDSRSIPSNTDLPTAALPNISNKRGPPTLIPHVITGINGAAAIATSFNCLLSAIPKLNNTFVLEPFTFLDSVGGRPSLSTVLPNLAACFLIASTPTSGVVLTPFTTRPPFSFISTNLIISYVL